MNHPRLYIKPNAGSTNGYGKHDTSVSWTVAFLPFAEPASSYSGERKKISVVNSPIIVGNDCIGITINNNKSSFAKTCSLTLKVTDVWYQSAVSPGDWVFVWISDSQEHQNEIQSLLRSNNFSNQQILNGFKSGLKFVGRVLSISSSDHISGSGQRTITQSVNCQAFLELATSVYDAKISASHFNRQETSPSSKDFEVVGNESSNASINANRRYAEDSLTANGANFLTDFAGKFLSLYNDAKIKYTPDQIIGWLFAITMGVDREKNPRNISAPTDSWGTFNDAIIIPKIVDGILGNRSATRLCQVYHVLLGVQKYTKLNGNHAQQLNPDLQNQNSRNSDQKEKKPNNQITNPVIYNTPTRCSGFVPFYPPSWDNNPIWNIFTPFLNPVVNEIYTALRINQDGIILPTLIVREIPLSTGLYEHLHDARLYPIKPDQDDFEPKHFDNSSDIAQDPKTYFGNLPRWVIDEGMITSINTRSNESERINFVQVWGSNGAAEMHGAQQQSLESMKSSQLNVGNYRADVADIQRHGLRAQFFKTTFDVMENGTTKTPEWARKRADWMFNGHLKLSGTINCVGIEEPICEGDNVEIRGIVYHIDGVTHSARISSNGLKEFTTTLQVSNGLVADSLDDKSPPKYAVHDQAAVRTSDNSPGYSYEVNKRPHNTKETGHKQQKESNDNKD